MRRSANRIICTVSKNPKSVTEPFQFLASRIYYYNPLRLISLNWEFLYKVLLISRVQSIPLRGWFLVSNKERPDHSTFLKSHFEKKVRESKKKDWIHDELSFSQWTQMWSRGKFSAAAAAAAAAAAGRSFTEE